MGRLDLNLSTRPFPAYRAANVALFGLLIVLVVISAWQLWSFANYSALAAGIREEERNTRAGAEALKERMEDLGSQLDRPDVASKLSEVEYFNSLIARRNLSWTRVFGTLEGIVPGAVHLRSLQPEIAEDGSMLFQIELRARSITDVSTFIERLEQSAAFEQVEVFQETRRDNGDYDITLNVRYLPEDPRP